MPLVTVEDAAPADQRVVDEVLERVAGAVAAALGRPAADVWARFVASDGVRVGPGGRHPVVTVATTAQRGGVEGVLRAAAGAVALALGVPAEDVWARFDELVPGTVLCGGRLQ